MSIIAWIVLGLAAGLIANILIPGRRQQGLVLTCVIGAVAAGQRHYFGSSRPSCAKASTIVVTIVAGPLNFAGVNPKVTCKASA